VALRKRKPAEGKSLEQREALRRLVARPKFELIPLTSAASAVDALPAASEVTVTASPSHGIEATLDLAEAASVLGHRATPHLSAHMIHDRAHLGELVARCRAAGLTDVFIVGGDAKDRGEFHDGLMLLRALDEMGHPFTRIGVPCYPQGHVDIAADRLLEVLGDKQRYATSMTTQMCFEPEAITDWIRRMRMAHITLPIHLGTPGVVELTKLMAISARIGIAGSARYLKKNRRMVGRLLSPGRFGPDAILEGMAETLADPAADVRAIHLFTFNQVEASVDWQERMLAEL
jgi:methylenetetrahydrofolate reductase (NADPH)